MIKPKRVALVIDKSKNMAISFKDEGYRKLVLDLASNLINQFDCERLELYCLDYKLRYISIATLDNLEKKLTDFIDYEFSTTDVDFTYVSIFTDLQKQFVWNSNGTDLPVYVCFLASHLSQISTLFGIGIFKDFSKFPILLNFVCNSTDYFDDLTKLLSREGITYKNIGVSTLDDALDNFELCDRDINFNLDKDYLNKIVYNDKIKNLFSMIMGFGYIVLKIVLCLLIMCYIAYIK